MSIETLPSWSPDDIERRVDQGVGSWGDLRDAETGGAPDVTTTSPGVVGPAPSFRRTDQTRVANRLVPGRTGHVRFSEVTARDKAAHELAGQGPLSEEQKEINRRGIDQFRRVAKAYSEGGVAAVQALNTDSQLAGQGVVETVRPVQDTLF
ncbi:MAG: hypothetical protein Q4F02_00260 [Candidatus Saccharibacteria bacterium]|nr:hypothetical protein [Candidatus Saccharibacteria bacterium]